MPSVTVVLKNGSSIEIEGANDAEWEFQKLAERQQGTTMVLTVLLKEPNKTETRGRFLANEVAGYTIDVR